MHVFTLRGQAAVGNESGDARAERREGQGRHQPKAGEGVVVVGVVVVAGCDGGGAMVPERFFKPAGRKRACRWGKCAHGVAHQVPEPGGPGGGGEGDGGGRRRLPPAPGGRGEGGGGEAPPEHEPPRRGPQSAQSWHGEQAEYSEPAPPSASIEWSKDQQRVCQLQLEGGQGRPQSEGARIGSGECGSGQAAAGAHASCSFKVAGRFGVVEELDGLGGRGGGTTVLRQP